jgi:hypothetical protein
VIGAGGVALLLVARPAALRLAGIVLLAIGLVPLVLHEQPSLGDRLQAHPLLVPLAGSCWAVRSPRAGPGSWLPAA